LEEAIEAYHVECAAQKVRKAVDPKAREEAKKRRIRGNNWSTSSNSETRC